MATIPNTRGNPQASDIAVQSALPLNGSGAREDLQTVLTTADSDAGRLYEDRNALLTDGGLITFLGTSVQFTGSLKLSLNSRVTGGAPVVIDLGSTTRNVSADGRMIYAVINRTAGTATVTDDAATLPSTVAANKELFLIAKRVDSADGIKRLYFRQGSALNEGGSARLGASGSGNGSGSGVGDDLGSLTMKASFTENLAELATDANVGIDYGAGKTDAAVYNVVNQYLRLAYDATKTVTGTGTSMTMSLAPSFTVKIGDMLIVGSQAKRITAVGSQTSYTIESAFSVDPSSSACTVSQAAYSKDLNAYAGNGNAASAAFSSAISQILMTYEDTTTLGDIIFDANTTPVIAYSVSTDNSNYTSKQVRPTNLSDSLSMLNISNPGTNLLVRFFANATSGSGSVNLTKYKVSFHRDVTSADGFIQNQAFSFTNGVGTEINCSAPSVVSGKTRLQMTFSYATGVNSGTTNGSIKVYLNGQKIPRFVDSTLTPDAYYKEIDSNTIELDRDYSAYQLSIEVIQDVHTVDTSDLNSSNVMSLQEIQQKQFSSFVDTSAQLAATTTTGSPAAGTFYSSISNRASIPDLSQDLKGRMGIDRLMTQQLYPILSEQGSTGELIYGVVGDVFNQIRLVGSWSQLTDQVSLRTSTVSDYAEITFYGTGLNLLCFGISASRDFRVSVDGGSEGSNVVPAGSSALEARNYPANIIVPLVSNLSLGIHTVKLRFAANANMTFHGFEFLTETTSLRIQPGSSYSNGKKLTLNSQQTVAHNSTFETGTLGTRGGRVLVYQKANGTIAKAVTPTNAARADLSSADHTNEEQIRVYHPREFGANRSGEDYNTLGLGGGSTRQSTFTLDDGTTSLTSSSGYFATVNSTEGLAWNGSSDYHQIQFVGTGLDIVLATSSATGALTVAVDGTSIGSLTLTATAVKQYKIVSGLPYGSHLVRFTLNTGANVVLKQLITYQPKKPTLPSGAVELSDYNVVADYSANTAGTIMPSQGVMRKSAHREMVLVGTWNVGSIDYQFGNGYNVQSTAGSSYAEYTFYGTGVDIKHYFNSSVSPNYAYTIDGVSNLTGAGYTTAFHAANAGSMAFNGATGVLSGTSSGSAAYGATVRIQNIPLGLHKLRVTYTSGYNMYLDTVDVTTPIHSNKYNALQDYQSTLLVGSQGLSDSRKITAIKEGYLQNKNVSQALGVVSGPTTSSTTLVPMPDMTVIHVNRSGRIRITFNSSVTHSISNGNIFTAIYIDGVIYGSGMLAANPSASAGVPIEIMDFANIPVSPGVHKIDIYWNVSGGTATANTTRRTLLVEEV